MSTTNRPMCRAFLCLAVFLPIFQSSKAQVTRVNRDDDLCQQISTLINASKTGFASITGAVIDQKQGSYISTQELSDWSQGFVYGEESGDRYVLYVSLGGNNLAQIKKRYNTSILRLTPCLPGWKRTQTASKEEVRSVFRHEPDGPAVELDYNIQPSKIGSTKYDLYLTITAPASVVEKSFCGQLSTLIDASRTGFVSIVGAVKDQEYGSHEATLKLAAWGSGSVYPKGDDPHVLYVMLGSNRIADVRNKYDVWFSKLVACLPEWKRTQTVSSEEVKTVFTTENTGGPSVELEYNRKPSRVGSTKYDLYLTVSNTRRAAQQRSPTLATKILRSAGSK